MNVPLPIKKYIEGASNTISPAGDAVTVNLPHVALPQGPIAAAEGQVAIPSGSFGDCTAATHNAYECYVSPYITRRLIERTVEANAIQPGATEAQQALYAARFRDWNPLPAGAYPANAVANRNLLGYQQPIQLTGEAISALTKCNFLDNSTMLGRLSHCAEAVTRVSTAVGKERRLKSARADFNYDSSTASLVFKVCETDPDPGLRLSEVQGKVSSPFAFASNDSNKANYFGYKRRRTEEQPGCCYLLAGVPVEGWSDTRNNNFEMAGEFIPRDELNDAPDLRLDKELEVFGVGLTVDALNQWLYRHMITDARV